MAMSHVQAAPGAPTSTMFPPTVGAAEDGQHTLAVDVPTATSVHLFVSE